MNLQRQSMISRELMKASSACAGISTLGELIANAQVDRDYEVINTHLEGIGLAIRELGSHLMFRLGEISEDMEIKPEAQKVA